MLAPFVIFCADPINPRSVDPAFAQEAEAARAAGYTVVVLDHDELDHRTDPGAALRSARFDGAGSAVYRGWMLRDVAYAALFDALARRGIDLVTSPAEYATCHHAPGSYAVLKRWMPATTWLPVSQMDDPAALDQTLAAFGAAPVVLKDWVKSQAGYWNEACFIPDASKADEARRVIRRFRELQGDSLVGGLVFKAYIPLEPVGSPAFEYRAFVVKGAAVGSWPRSREAADLGAPPSALLDEVAASVPSPFAAADFGRDADGRWWLLEVGDGQVSGLPVAEAAGAIYAALRDALTPA
ncbi:ATP-grasp domain-containing protein [Caulobacter sp. 17J65-9]|uniref:ATP-grasp domain-containing protein n=1 Tax=Caulobacter sp. 17J65-9 TaxID=2709382 RepID=UPI0013CC48F2|nr:ATP-grasp domain-containing protein [Caulobacter sp. 17J65-9]NEX94920.1 ATP-grasp domain-containing protein [Caulobacter sp. 17J65-9]